MASFKEVAKAFEILQKYSKKALQVEGAHDVLFALGAPKEGVSAEDTAKLEKLGWAWDGEYDCWRMFT
jgi:hypothetical protein